MGFFFFLEPCRFSGCLLAAARAQTREAEERLAENVPQESQETDRGEAKRDPKDRLEAAREKRRLENRPSQSDRCFFCRLSDERPRGSAHYRERAESPSLVTARARAPFMKSQTQMNRVRNVLLRSSIEGFSISSSSSKGSTARSTVALNE